MTLQCMKSVIFVFAALTVLVALMVSAGCNGPGGGQPAKTPTTVSTPVRTTLPETTIVPTTTRGSLVPGPIDTLPSASPVDINVEKAGTYSTTIIAHFNGGKGMSFVSKVDVLVTRADGSVVTGMLIPQMGQTAEFEGTNGTDRVEVTVTMKTGNKYKLIDQLLPYKTRG
jgi:hypothetical protein